MSSTSDRPSPARGSQTAGRAETIALMGAVPPPPRPAPRETRPASSEARPAPGEARPAPARREGAAKVCPTCGERFPVDYMVCPRDVVDLDLETDDDRDRYLGTTLAGTYRIVRRVGVGGMGSVYEASHTRLDSRHLAVKIMHDELARKGDLAERFRREAEVAGLARHENVIEVYDLDQTPEGIPFIVAEYLDGEDLGQRLEREGTLSLADTVQVVRQLCAALTVLHRVGVVHRDLKPDNVFLVGTGEPRVKLLDFGIARLTGAGPGNRTQTGVVMGTPAYMAPEQARGARVDHRCDVYAVGAIVYRCLTGRALYDDDDPAATLTAVLTQEPERPRAVVPDLPEEVELVIERAIARNLDERFQSMAELAAALEALVAPRPVRSAEVSTTEGGIDGGVDVGRLVRRARPTIAGATVLGVLLLVGVVSDLAARIIAYSSDSGVLTANESTLIVVGVVATLATPTALWVRMLVTRVWHNSLRAVALARRSVVTLAAAASAYAAVVLLGRVLDLALSGSPSTSSGLLAALLATSAAAAATVLGLARRRLLRGRDRGGDEPAAVEAAASSPAGSASIEYVPPAHTVPIDDGG